MHQDNKLSELVELMITLLKPDLATAEAWKNMQVSTSAWLQDFNTSTSFNENTISAIRQTTSNRKHQYLRNVFCLYIVREFIKVD
mgnify:CR=1 FL=1